MQVPKLSHLYYHNYTTSYLLITVNLVSKVLVQRPVQFLMIKLPHALVYWLL
jgi:hypothetical protein